jgi:hypothetical protein
MWGYRSVSQVLKNNSVGWVKQRDTTVSKIVVLTALALAFVALEIGPEVAMAVH